METLIKLGFENVKWAEDEVERIFVIENTSYTLVGAVVRQALDQIQQTGLVAGKQCSVIVLDHNVPQMVLRCHATADGRSPATVTYGDWVASYELGDSWRKVKDSKAKNRSFNKVDIVLIPEFLWRNRLLEVPYEVVLNFSPSVEVSLWPGMRAAFQVVFPIVNDYGQDFAGIRPGFVTLSQSFRLPKRTFVDLTIGSFGNSFRYGADVKVRHILPNEHFSLEAQAGYTAEGRFKSFAYHYQDQWIWTGHIGANYFWSKYNTMLSARIERYLLGEYGVRFDLTQHFKYATIGFYAMKIRDPHIAGLPALYKYGLDGGFKIQVSLPPYHSKRKGYYPRIKGGYTRVEYAAAVDPNYGRYYRAGTADHFRQGISYNPYYMKNELMNY